MDKSEVVLKDVDDLNSLKKWLQQKIYIGFFWSKI